jgi:hypothetical protein
VIGVSARHVITFEQARRRLFARPADEVGRGHFAAPSEGGAKAGVDMESGKAVVLAALLLSVTVIVLAFSSCGQGLAHDEDERPGYTSG